MIRLGSTIIIGGLIWFVYVALGRTGVSKISLGDLKCIFSFSSECTYYLQPYTPIVIYIGFTLWVAGIIKGIKEEVK